MKVDFDVKEKKNGFPGSALMRGVQVATAGGWTVNSFSSRPDVRVIVKKGSGTLLSPARVTIWDPVDFWPQPERGDMQIVSAGGDRDIISALEDARKKTGSVPKNAVIISITKTMRDILNENGYRTFYIPHHYQPGIEQNPIRKKAEILGYEGSEKFLGDDLRQRLSKLATSLGMRFVVNPGKKYGTDGLKEMDIAILIRSKVHTNIFTTQLKSGVKIANCYASGTPFVSQMDAAAAEMEAPCTFSSNRFDGTDFAELEYHVSSLAKDYDRRKLLSDMGKIKAKEWSLEESIIPMYRAVFYRLINENSV